MPTARALTHFPFSNLPPPGTMADDIRSCRSPYSSKSSSFIEPTKEPAQLSPPSLSRLESERIDAMDTCILLLFSSCWPFVSQEKVRESGPKTNASTREGYNLF